MADRLTVSLCTVKKRVQNTHGKLGVNRRTHAVVRAAGLNLL